MEIYLKIISEEIPYPYLPHPLSLLWHSSAEMVSPSAECLYFGINAP